jgi:hypothetical protein
MVLGHNVLRARRTMDTRSQRLATLEPSSEIQRTRRRRADTEMVVGRQQLEDPGREVKVEGHEAG